MARPRMQLRDGWTLEDDVRLNRNSTNNSRCATRVYPFTARRCE
jgi:hypothetical protein